ncbi:hypothetical protein B0T20DRAFT_81617 [Sordaria brevicollis]|uniref:Uncharacterized protein n=1 Tax=Sordaria brevicollis TaxID=83679 RepID=A0AAE0U5V4_SORBR|nr:hypothetical protein B0T20DRAFT_81617 [Sordaria brevicollis]
MSGNRETSISTSGSRSPYYSSRTASLSSITNSRLSANSVSFRSGTAANHHVIAQEKSKVVVIHHNQPNPAKDEPRSSDYYRR